MSGGIVAVLEAQAPDRREWWVLASDILVDVVESRLLFATLVGRVATLPIVQPIPAPRGLPHDVDAKTRERAAEWGSLVEDASWVSYAELAEATQYLRDYCASLGDEQSRSEAPQNWISVSMLALLAYMQVFEEHGYETRMVFWFTPV